MILLIGFIAFHNNNNIMWLLLDNALYGRRSGCTLTYAMSCYLSLGTNSFDSVSEPKWYKTIRSIKLIWFCRLQSSHFVPGLASLNGLNLTSTRINDCIDNKVLDEITCPLPNFNDATVEVCECLSNFILHSLYYYSSISSLYLAKLHIIVWGEGVRAVMLQNGCHIAGDNFKLIFLNENYCILNQISMLFVPKDRMFCHWCR